MHLPSPNVFQKISVSCCDHIFCCLLYQVTSLSVTQSRYDNMVTIRSSEVPGGYVGTVQAMYWAALADDMQEAIDAGAPTSALACR